MTAMNFDDFMSNINCGIGVLHVKRQIHSPHRVCLRHAHAPCAN